ncbi:alpha/beta hydrolase [Puniceicoccales bacterium CK1056]|uniref:Alpha/beta hydrolase n=1 Tax=Oceanipulchritudo coccoides TaxID=2706888 RepID=A0A6B2M0B3_9BACT|nr:alpha/beta hydrolase [Oceanipulchritudo coccoides]NDV61467.1 alpha/beta hydrolase [Oceanipulchritudo coccoides]
MKSILLKLVAALWLIPPAFLVAGPPEPPSGWTEGYVMANGIRLHYWRTGGDKPVMVMAHGFSDDGLCWTQLAVELTDQFDLILFDARGHGLSDAPNRSDPADAQVEDLAGLIKALELKNPILMGHSMGSASVAWFAARYPDVPKAIILEDPRLVGRSPLSSGEVSEEDLKKRAATILEQNNKTYDEIVEHGLKQNPSWGEAEIRIWAASKQRHHPNLVYRTFSQDRPSTSDLFKKITCPTLILKADAGEKLRRENEQVAAHLKNGKLVHIESAGHNVRREQKERLLQALMPFLHSL